jgi:hypothetical protein
MQGTHAFSTDRRKRRRKVYFGIGAVGLLITLYLGPALAMLTGIGDFASISISFTLCATAGYLVVSRWLWRVDALAGVLGSPPALSGRWEGYLYTSSDEYNEDEVLAVDQLGYDLAKMEITMRIDQTWDAIGVYFDGPESDSDSTGATFVLDADSDEAATLTYNYENDGDDLSDLEHHVGTTMLEYNPKSDTLEGTYYTGPNRGNYGLIKVERVEHP